MSEREMLVLKALAEGDPDMGYFGFAAIAGRSGIDLRHIRRTVRALARKGLAVYGKGLWTDDGEPAGSGYAITKLGRETLAVENAS